MRMVRPRLTLLLLSVSIAACGGTPATSASKQIDVGVITTSPINQGTYDPAHYAAYSKVFAQYGWHLKLAEAVPYGQGPQTFDRFGSQGLPYVFVTDNGEAQAMLDAAKKYPNTKFIMMSDIDSTQGLPNVTAYTFNWYEIGYIAGVESALASKTHVIGGISGQPIPAALKVFGGARFGADQAVPGTTLKIQYVNDWADAAKAREVAGALLGQKADVLFGLLAGMESAVAQAVAAGNAQYIGWLVDESKLYPVTTASVTVNFLSQYEAAAKMLSSGHFDASIHRGTIEGGIITYVPFNGSNASYDGTLQQFVNKVKSGQLTVPSQGATQ